VRLRGSKIHKPDVINIESMGEFKNKKISRKKSPRYLGSISIELKNRKIPETMTMFNATPRYPRFMYPSLINPLFEFISGAAKYRSEMT
jgi:hypothetical protein